MPNPPSQRCRATMRGGARCARLTTSPTGLCYVHAPASRPAEVSARLVRLKTLCRVVDEGGPYIKVVVIPGVVRWYTRAAFANTFEELLDADQ